MIHREISDKNFQMDSLDGLRGFAALLVVFSHTSNAGMFFIPLFDLRGIGKSGVFLFFLLSSFLLALPLIRKDRNIFTYPVMSNYWQRRFFRIYPLYTLYLLLGVLSTWVITTFLGKSGVGIPFELDWMGFFKHIALFEGKGVTWSIAVEFKFYFILPILVLAIIYVRSFGHIITMCVFCVLMLVSQAISPQSESLSNDYRLLPYMPIFIMGIFLAVLHEHLSSHKPSKIVNTILKWLGFIGVTGIVLMTPLVFSLINERVPNNYFHKQFILYALFWSFIILSAVNVSGIIQKIFSLKLLRYYGALSFSLYLFHPIFIFVFGKIGMSGYLSAWMVLFASTVSAYFSFRLLEGPVSKYKFKPIRRPTRA